MSNSIKGKILKISPIQVKSDKFSFVEVVLEVTDDKFTSTPIIQFSNARADLLQNFEVGNEVEISFNLTGRYHEGTDKYYNTVAGWKIQFVGVGAAAQQPKPKQQEIITDNNGDDLPF